MLDDPLVFVLVAIGAIVIDLFVPTGGILSGAGIALLIERVLAWAGVDGLVRWPLAAVGMLATVGLAMRFGERLADRLVPSRTQTNVDRLVGSRGTVRRLEPVGLVLELEGDHWRGQLVDGARPVDEGDPVQVVALVDQVPYVARVDDPVLDPPIDSERPD